MMGVTTVTTGDGLYDNGDGTYTYKGANPDNYLSFAENAWRILRIDSTGIKVVRDEKLDTLMPFEAEGIRTTENNSYCDIPSYGCNIWSKDYSPSGDFNNGSAIGIVTEDSTLKIYLNGDYLINTLGNDSNIVYGTYNMGPGSRETDYTWTGKVALLTYPEYTSAGGASSYLKKSYHWWLLSPYMSDSYSVRFIRSTGAPADYKAIGNIGMRPTFYLSPNIILTGSGTNDANIFALS